MALLGDYIVFSADPSDPLVPYFELVLTRGNTRLAVHIPGIGNLTPAQQVLVPGTFGQVGVRYWYADGAHRWEYIVGGVVEAGTGPIWVAPQASLDVNVVAIGSGLVSGVSKPGRYDELRFWRPGNGLTDADIWNISVAHGSLGGTLSGTVSLAGLLSAHDQFAGTLENY